MIPKPINDISLSDLQALIGNVREGKTIEYKSDMPGRAATETGPFLAGVSSLANTSGGDFVLGIKEDAGLATAIPAIEFINLDAEKLRLEQLLANGLEPRLPRVDIHPVHCGNGRHVLVIRTAKSWLAPHRVKLNDKFYGRNSAGKYPLDVSELRTAFILSETLAERTRAFHAERTIRIADRDLPLLLTPDVPVLVLHLVPYSAFDLGRSLSLADVENHSANFPPLGRDWPQHQGINFDGFLGLANRDLTGRDGSAAEQAAYILVFRSGIIEGVAKLTSGDGIFRTIELESTIVRYTWRYAGALSNEGVEPPFVVLVSLLGVRNAPFLVGHGSSFEPPTSNFADRDQYHFVETLLNAVPTDPVECATALRFTLDHLANVGGMPRTPTFDAAGKYLLRV
jgi:hypothetical protein